MDTRAKNESIAVVGDYDVDGISGTALTIAGLRSCRINCIPILPNRLIDGYGFQPAQVQKAKENGCSTIVTVDCGSNSHPALELARALGIRVIVTDHHIIDDPSFRVEGYSLINPLQPACRYPFKGLSGSGLAFKLITALFLKLGLSINYPALLRVSSLGTIADLVPLIGENRTIASLGLAELPETNSVGLRALFESINIKAPFSSEDVSFQIAPRINAPGRLGSAEKALELFLTRDPKRARILAQQLNEVNEQRKAIERQITSEVENSLKGLDIRPPLVAWSKRWHLGVIGIVSGRFAKKLSCPVILFSEQGDFAIGSGRSNGVVDLKRFLDPWKSSFVKFGGHSQAVGIKVASRLLPKLKSEWQEGLDANVANSQGDAPYVIYEVALPARLVNIDTALTIRRLGPFGQNNPNPIIRILDRLRVRTSPRVTASGIFATVESCFDLSSFAVVAWNLREKFDILLGEFELLGQIEFDRIHSTPILKVIDIRPCLSGGGD